MHRLHRCRPYFVLWRGEHCASIHNAARALFAFLGIVISFFSVILCFSLFQCAANVQQQSQIERRPWPAHPSHYPTCFFTSCGDACWIGGALFTQIVGSASSQEICLARSVLVLLVSVWSRGHGLDDVISTEEAPGANTTPHLRTFRTSAHVNFLAWLKTEPELRLKLFVSCLTRSSSLRVCHVSFMRTVT